MCKVCGIASSRWHALVYVLAVFVSCFTNNHVVNFMIISMNGVKSKYNFMRTGKNKLWFALIFFIFYCCLYFCGFPRHPQTPLSLTCDSVSNIGFKFPKEVLSPCFLDSLIDWSLKEKEWNSGYSEPPWLHQRFSRPVFAHKSAGPQTISPACAEPSVWFLERLSGFGQVPFFISTTSRDAYLSGSERFSWLIIIITLDIWRVLGFVFFFK